MKINAFQCADITFNGRLLKQLFWSLKQIFRKFHTWLRTDHSKIISGKIRIIKNKKKKKIEILK